MDRNKIITLIVFGIILFIFVVMMIVIWGINPEPIHIGG